MIDNMFDIEEEDLLKKHMKISRFLVKKGVKIREHQYTESKAS